MPRNNFPNALKRKKLLVWTGALVFVVLIAVGVFAKNGWLPDSARTTWFGKPIDASSSSNPFAAPLPNPTPTLSREYIHAGGGRLLAVEDANANPAAPADLAIWRPSTGTWWVMGSQYSQYVTQTWGLETDKPAAGDFDGDGKTDFSVFRPSTGEWFVLQSSDGTWASVISWGTSTDRLVPADYDGDGKTDRAVWRPADGTWYVISSSTSSANYYYYGTGGDIPAPADYDGDGRADIAVWRNSDQKFYWINSSNNTSTSLAMNQSSSDPVSGDYDGDGKADHAIRNGSNWVIRQSTNGQTLTIGWQQSGDLAVPNDYDGDGKCDIAVWRQTDAPVGTLGNWYIRQSASGNSLRQVQWGIAADIPVPAFYRR
jgi:hypothetical protein